MKARRRLVLAAGVALVFTFGMVLVFVVTRVQRKEAEQVPAEVTPVVLEENAAPRVEEVSHRSQFEEPEGEGSTQVTFEEPKEQLSRGDEQPIEEVLSETGEDPGAVFYMSRVREALVEGNPRFARELLRQMKAEHSGSVLVRAAEDLFRE
jgi:Na+-transporting methylmalonyl-CoA/oxaloacetate decarboxylase gamma subunit